MNRADAATPVELVRNGGFETGHPPVPWTQDRSRGRTLVATGGPDGGPAAGKYSIRLGGSNNESDRIAQEFLIPPGVAAVDLTFRYRIRHNGNGSADGDRLRVAVADVENGTERVVLDLTGADDTTGEWRVAGPVSLLPEAGRYVALSFTGTTDKDKPTSFSLDEVRAVAIPSGRASEIKLSFVNPRLGCRDILTPRDVTASGLLPIDVVAGEDGGIAALFLELDGRRIAREHQARLHFDLDTTTLSPGPHVLEAQAITTDGRLRVCRIDITPLDILRNGNFEEALDLDNWVYSTNAAGRQPLAGGPDPLPADGNLMAALGGVSRVTEKLTQSLHFPADLAAATLSYHVRIATTRNQAGVDLLRVKLRHVPLVGTPTETILATYANPTSSETGWTLEGIAIPPDTITSLAGKDVQLVFEAVNGGGMGASTASTFFVDAVALMAQSNLLVTLNAPQVELTFNPVGPALCPTASGGAVTFTAKATTIASPTVDLIQVFMDGTEIEHLVAQCSNCTQTAPTPLVLPSAGCHEFVVKGEFQGVQTWGAATRIHYDPAPSSGSGCSPGQPLPPPAMLSAPLFGELLDGLRFISAVTPESACFARTEVILERTNDPADTAIIHSTDSAFVAFNWLAGDHPSGFYRLRFRNSSITGVTSETISPIFEIATQNCWQSQRCSGDNMNRWLTGCPQGTDPVHCLRLALCSTTRVFAAFGAAEDWDETVFGSLSTAISAMEHQRASSGYSIFNSYPAVAIGLTALEVERRMAMRGDSRSLDDVLAPSEVGLYQGIPAWGRIANILIDAADRYPIGPSPDVEGCGIDPEVGDTCAEERSGQAAILLLTELLFPSADEVTCRTRSLPEFVAASLSGQAHSYPCRNSNMVLPADVALQFCPLPQPDSPPMLRMYNHGEENPPYAAAVASQFAVLEGIGRTFAAPMELTEPTRNQLLLLFRWASSKAVTSFDYAKSDCLRLEKVEVADRCELPFEDKVYNPTTRKDEPAQTCEIWPHLTSCAENCSHDSPPMLQGGRVDCSDYCQTSAGVPRQPCWNPLLAFLSRHFSQGQLDTLPKAALFDEALSRSRSNYKDETDLFYYEFAVRLPAAVEISGSRYGEKCSSQLAPRITALTMLPNTGARIEWNSFGGANEIRVFRKVDTGVGPECSPSSGSCGWRLLATLPAAQAQSYIDCSASECAAYWYAIEATRGTCAPTGSSPAYLPRSEPCSSIPLPGCTGQPD